MERNSSKAQINDISRVKDRPSDIRRVVRHSGTDVRLIKAMLDKRI